jgi:hypothetical protein
MAGAASPHCLAPGQGSVEIFDKSSRDRADHLSLTHWHLIDESRLKMEEVVSESRTRSVGFGHAIDTNHHERALTYSSLDHRAITSMPQVVSCPGRLENMLARCRLVLATCACGREY